jgi:hypothetical protein
MGLVLGLLFVALLFWWVARRSATKTNRGARRATSALSPAGPAPRSATDGLRAGAPFTLTGRTYRLSRNGRVSVVGEHYRRKEIARVVKGHRVAAAGDWDNALRREAVLIPEPTNKHDRNAVRVLLEAGDDWAHVGYLSADHAAEYVGVCNHLIEQGRVPLADGRIVKSRDGHGVYLHLAAPDSCLFINDEPDGPVLDPQRQCAVTKENQHQDVLGGMEHGLYWATLHPSTVSAGKYAGDFTIEVQIDGRRVGELTAAQGSRYRSLVSSTSPSACEAEVFAGKTFTEVSLALPRVD